MEQFVTRLHVGVCGYPGHLMLGSVEPHLDGRPGTEPYLSQVLGGDVGLDVPEGVDPPGLAAHGVPLMLGQRQQQRYEGSRFDVGSEIIHSGVTRSEQRRSRSEAVPPLEGGSCGGDDQFGVLDGDYPLCPLDDGHRRR